MSTYHVVSVSIAMDSRWGIQRRMPDGQNELLPGTFQNRQEAEAEARRLADLEAESDDA